MPGERAKKPAAKKAGDDTAATGVAKNFDLNVKKPKKGKPISAKILSWLEELAGTPNLLLPGLLSLLILQGKESMLSACSAAP